MFEAILGTQHNSDTHLAARHGLAWETARQGALSQAEAALRDICHARDRLHGGTHLDTLESLNDLAWVIARQGRRAEAERTHRTVLRNRKHILGNAHPDTTETEQALKALRRSPVTPASRTRRT
jgi:hypothetical protein